MKGLLAPLAAAIAAAGCGDPGAALCTGVAGKCRGIAAGAAEKSVQEAFVSVTDGTTIVFGEGTFKFVNTLSLAAPNVKVRGQGMEKTRLDFAEQVAGSGVGVFAKGDGFLIEDIAVVNTLGDAVKVEGAKGVTFRRTKVEWTNTSENNHGAYGLYPVQCENVLVEDSQVFGAADAGIYVGQSKGIIVRKNRAAQNVAGIEIENSHDADVYENVADDNTAGILVFALPGLQVKDTKRVRVFKNTIKDNNHTNFADKAGVVGKVPAGTGVILMASDGVEVFQNTIAGHKTGNVAVVSYFVTLLEIKDMAYYAYPINVWIHDNTFMGGGEKPDDTNLLGIALSKTPFPGGIVSTVIYDGIVDKARMGTRPGNPMDLCLSANGTITFANLHADMMSMGMVGFDMLSTDMKPYECMLAPLPAVSLPGVM